MMVSPGSGTETTGQAVQTDPQYVQELLKKSGALSFGEFKLASGKVSNYYFDSKQLTMDPEGAEFVSAQMVARLESEDLDVVGGTAYSAIPIVANISLYSQLKGSRPISAFYTRKESKGHGTDKHAEGKVPGPDTRVAIVEDVVTTGQSLIDSIKLAENEGCQVTHAFVLVDRAEGGKEAVEKLGYKFWSLFTVCHTPNGEIELRFNGV